MDNDRAEAACLVGAVVVHVRNHLLHRGVETAYDLDGRHGAVVEVQGFLLHLPILGEIVLVRASRRQGVLVRAVQLHQPPAAYRTQPRAELWERREAALLHQLHGHRALPAVLLMAPAPDAHHLQPRDPVDAGRRRGRRGGRVEPDCGPILVVAVVLAVARTRVDFINTPPLRCVLGGVRIPRAGHSVKVVLPHRDGHGIRLSRHPFELGPPRRCGQVQLPLERALPLRPHGCIL
mmetsp:Transcript_27445/g.73204  ORF Transcript_27445/g.73204 Transcript_27445/m.73204 type:complete len:235 (+) Transcript_27445:386-1090(+)